MNKLYTTSCEQMKNFRKFIILACLCTIFAGCAKPKPFIFYPPGSEIPRIQHLGSYSSLSDLRNNLFLDAMLGDDNEYRLQRPYGVAIHGHELFVVDASKKINGYSIFDLKKKKLKTVSGFFQKPIGIAVAKDGMRYVSDTELHAVMVLNQNNKLIMTIKPEGTFRPVGLAIKGNKLYVSDIREGLIRVFDRLTGAHLTDYGTAEKLGWPAGIAVDQEGNIMVVETGLTRVSKFTADGVFIKALGQLGSRYGDFIRPKDIAIDKNGRFMVIDAATQVVQIFDPEGQLLLGFGGMTSGPEAMVMPAGITINYGAVPYFQDRIAPGFKVEYLIAVTSQGSPNRAGKVSIYGLGKMEGTDYTIPQK